MQEQQRPLSVDILLTELEVRTAITGPSITIRRAPEIPIRAILDIRIEPEPPIDVTARISVNGVSVALEDFRCVPEWVVPRSEAGRVVDMMLEEGDPDKAFFDLGAVDSFTVRFDSMPLAGSNLVMRGWAIRCGNQEPPFYMLEGCRAQRATASAGLPEPTGRRAMLG